MRKIAFLLILLFLFCSCAKARSFSYEGSENVSSVIQSETRFLLPNAGELENTIENSVVCRKISPDEFALYLDELQNDGWELLYKYTLIKRNSEITILDQTFVDTNNPHSEQNYISINFKSGCKNSDSIGRTSIDDAMALIQEEIETYESKDMYFGKKVYKVIEWDEEEAFSKTGIQIFTAYEADGRIGDYMVHENDVLPVWFIDELTVVDIDNDGIYELLNICGWGSGIYRIEISAYKFSNPIYFNSYTEVLHRSYYRCYIPVNGYAELYLVKVSETEVHLCGTEEKDGAEQQIDYGALKTDSGNFIVDAKDFPFKEWN